MVKWSSVAGIAHQFAAMQVAGLAIEPGIVLHRLSARRGAGVACAAGDRRSFRPRIGDGNIAR